MNAVRKSCRLCRGDAGVFDPSGAHYLCQAREELGLPTPSLGRFCEDCNGTGQTSKSDVILYDPSQAMLDRVFPRCQTCRGRGVIGT